MWAQFGQANIIHLECIYETPLLSLVLQDCIFFDTFETHHRDIYRKTFWIEHRTVLRGTPTTPQAPLLHHHSSAVLNRCLCIYIYIRNRKKTRKHVEKKENVWDVIGGMEQGG